MITVIKKGATRKNIKRLFEQLKKDSKPKGVDVYKYLGKIKLKKDALDIQKEIRNEWE